MAALIFLQHDAFARIGGLIGQIAGGADGGGRVEHARPQHQAETRIGRHRPLDASIIEVVVEGAAGPLGRLIAPRSRPRRRSAIVRHRQAHAQVLGHVARQQGRDHGVDLVVRVGRPFAGARGRTAVTGVVHAQDQPLILQQLDAEIHLGDDQTVGQVIVGGNAGQGLEPLGRRAPLSRR
ncbi:hypothetical protein D3C73_1173320 [compost metagenome]